MPTGRIETCISRRVCSTRVRLHRMCSVGGDATALYRRWLEHSLDDSAGRIASRVWPTQRLLKCVKCHHVELAEDQPIYFPQPDHNLRVYRLYVLGCPGVLQSQSTIPIGLLSCRVNARPFPESKVGSRCTVPRIGHLITCRC